MPICKELVVNPRVCPLCGQENHCAMAAVGGTATTDPCWCTNQQFPATLLEKVPVAARDKFCICQSCLAKFASGK